MTFRRNRFRTAAFAIPAISPAFQFQPIMPAIPPNKPYRIGRSRTGLGLFATKPIEKGAKIVRYSGPLLDARKYKDLENKYLFELDGRWFIDGSVRSNIARYINHACKPNAESNVRPRLRRVDIRAIKNISPGEEINYDYGTAYFKMYLKKIGCKCDACENKRKKLRAEQREAKRRAKARAEKRAAKARALNGHCGKTRAAEKSRPSRLGASAGKAKRRGRKRRAPLS